MEEYKVLLISIIKKRSIYVSTSGNSKIYDILPIENRTDSFSSWKFDPLAGHMKVYIEMEPVGELFPKKWRLDETVSFFSLKFVKDFV
jgi:hypothetical protein